MNDYQRGLLRAAEIVGHCEVAAALADTGWERGYAAALRVMDSAIRAEAEKAAEAPAVGPVAYRFFCDGQWFTGTTKEGCESVLRQAGLVADIEPLYATCVSAPSAPDEALIEEIAEKGNRYWYQHRGVNVLDAIDWAIREYLKLSGNRLGALPESKCVTYGDKTHESSN